MSQFIEMFGDFHNKVQIKDICLVVSGKSIPTKLEDIDGNNPYIKVADFNIPGNEKYITIAQRYVSDDSASYSKQIPEGSVIFAKNGAASMSNKKRLTKIRCCIDMNTMAVFPKNESILSDFLFATIEAMDVSSHVRQGAIPSISPKSIEDSYIAMPTMEEQYRYVSIAKHADKSGFDGFKSQFIEMFKGDNQVPLGDICNIEKGATITRNDVLPGEVPVVAGGQEPSCYHNVANREAGAITVSASGAYAGYINFWNCPIFASDCNTIISKDDEKTDQTFVYFGLRAMQKQIYGLQKGGAQPHVYGKDLQKFMFPCPSYAKQIEFSKMAKQADKSGSVLQHMIAC